MKLDKSKNYETVHGAPGISFHQNGIYFNGSGEEVQVGQVDTQDEKGKMIKQDIGINIEKNDEEPSVPTEQKSDIPNFEKPKPKKYVNIMSIAECEEELNSAGVEWQPTIDVLKKEFEGHPQGKRPPIVKTLRGMVKDLRESKK